MKTHVESRNTYGRAHCGAGTKVTLVTVPTCLRCLDEAARRTILTAIQAQYKETAA